MDKENDAISGHENDADGVEEIAPESKESTNAAYKVLSIVRLHGCAQLALLKAVHYKCCRHFVATIRFPLVSSI